MVYFTATFKVMCAANRSMFRSQSQKQNNSWKVGILSKTREPPQGNKTGSKRVSIWCLGSYIRHLMLHIKH